MFLPFALKEFHLTPRRQKLVSSYGRISPVSRTFYSHSIVIMVSSGSPFSWEKLTFERYLGESSCSIPALTMPSITAFAESPSISASLFRMLCRWILHGESHLSVSCARNGAWRVSDSRSGQETASAARTFFWRLGGSSFSRTVHVFHIFNGGPAAMNAGSSRYAVRRTLRQKSSASH